MAGHNNTFIVPNSLEVSPALNATFQVGQGQPNVGLNNAVVVYDNVEISPELNASLQGLHGQPNVGLNNTIVVYDNVEISPELNASFQGMQGQPAVGLNNTVVVYDNVEVSPELNATFEVGQGHPGGGLNNAFVVHDSLVLSPDLNAGFQMPPMAQSSPSSPQHSPPFVMGAEPLAASTPPSPFHPYEPPISVQPGDIFQQIPGPAPALDGSYNVPPEMNATFQVNPAQATAMHNATFEVPAVSVIPPGWEAPMTPVNQNVPPRPIYIDIVEEDRLRRRQARFQRATDRARRRARRQPETTESCTTREVPRRSRRGDGGGCMRM